MDIMDRSKTYKPRGISEAKLDAILKQVDAESSTISYYTQDIPLELLKMRWSSDSMYIPEYQREYTWTPHQRARFIESLLLRLPIPFLFFWESENNRLEIVDGSQRIRTVVAFLSDQLKLSELDRLTETSGLIFSELPESTQRRLNNTTIRGVILDPHTEERSRRDLFDRINTSALRLMPAEVRRGTSDGPFLDLVIGLTKHQVFQDIAPMTPIDKSKRFDEELITRLFAYSDDLSDYRDNVLEFTRAYTERMNDAIKRDPGLKEKMRNEFEACVDFVKRSFPYGVRKTPKGKKTYSARFEAIMVGSMLAIKDDPNLLERVVDVTNWITSDDFDDVVTSDAANVKSKLQKRIGFVRQRLLEK